MTPTDIEKDGYCAFVRGEDATRCPFGFINSRFWDSKDYAGFEAERWKLDAWMRGWLKAQKASVTAPTSTGRNDG